MDFSSITFQGKTQSLTEWSIELGYKHVTLYARLRAGWCIDRAFTVPVDARCHSKGKRVRHGLTNQHHYEYITWLSMKARCENKSSKRYSEWGGRGIFVCERWQNFANFFSDMGSRPSNSHSIDRIDNDGPYSPDNCRWATRKEQNRNQSSNRTLELNGLSKTTAEWSEITGIKSHTILARIDRHGWTVSDALTTPARKMNGPIRNNQKSA